MRRISVLTPRTPYAHSTGDRIDYVILLTYFAFVIGIGWVLKRYMKGSTDFFLSGRSIPAWVTGLAFISANLGAQEVIGMAASGAKYGIMTSHFYWVGAIPAMVFLAIFMMPFYYGSKARSVPEYLKLRFDEKTRGFNAISFAVMTVFSSGISMYALARLLEMLLDWNFNLSIAISAFIVLVYIFLGGLTSAIYNEVLQFFMIVLGFAPLVFLALKDVGGWSGLKEKLIPVATSQGFAAGHLDAILGAHGQRHRQSDGRRTGSAWSMGLGFVLSFGYWCTDFLVVQRAMAANSMSAARRTPLIAAIPKMLFPALVILPGMIAIALHYASGDTFLPLGKRRHAGLQHDDSLAAGEIFPDRPAGHRLHGADGVVHVRHGGQCHRVQHGLDLRHLSELHRARKNPDQPLSLDGPLGHGRSAFSSASARPIWRRQFNNIMDMLQLVFGFVNAPLFATFLLGMFWKRATGHGAFLRPAGRHAGRGDFSWTGAHQGRGGRASKAAGLRRAYSISTAKWRKISPWPLSPGPPASC